MGLSIALTPIREDWRPTLQRAMTSGGESRVVVANPSLPGVVLPRSVASTTTAAVTVLAMVEVASEVTLAAPPPPVVAEEEREIELPASPGGGLHGSPSRSALKVPGDVAGLEPEHLPMAREDKVVEIPSDDEADEVVELPASSRELAVVRSEGGPSSGLEETDLVWPYPEDPTKVWLIL